MKAVKQELTWICQEHASVKTTWFPPNGHSNRYTLNCSKT